MALNTAVDLLKSLVTVLEEIRHQFDDFEMRGIERVGHNNYKASTRRFRKRNRMHDDGNGPDTMIQGSDSRLKTSIPSNY